MPLSTCSCRRLPPLSPVLSFPASLIMCTKISPSSFHGDVPKDKLLQTSRCGSSFGFAGSQFLYLHSCPQESHLSMTEEHNLGIPCPVLRMTGTGSPIKAQQKVSSGPRTLGEEPMEGSRPFLNSGLRGTALAPHRNASWDWVREKVERVGCVCKHGTSPMSCFFILLLRAHPSQKDPRGHLLGSVFRIFHFCALENRKFGSESPSAFWAEHGAHLGTAWHEQIPLRPCFPGEVSSCAKHNFVLKLRVRTKQRLWLDKYSRAVSNGVWGLLG